MDSPKKINNSLNELWLQFCHGDDSMLGNVFRETYNELVFYGLKLVPIQELVKDTIRDVSADIWSRKKDLKDVNNIRSVVSGR